MLLLVPRLIPTFLVGKISYWSSDQRVFAMLVGRPAGYCLLVWGLTGAFLTVVPTTSAGGRAVRELGGVQQLLIPFIFFFLPFQ